jgi:NADPH:quinone reductase-like Zn-dependent oxidoreductase
MHALVLNELKAPLELTQREKLVPTQNEVIVSLRAAALNRRDYWITQGMYPGVKLPVVLGSDGAGVVSSLGEGVDSKWLDQEVIINPGFNWGDDPRAQSDSFEILGMPRDGTFAEEVAVPASALSPKPAHLDWEHAAALPLAGLTAFRAVVTKGKVKNGETVLVTGIGGGVATFAAQFAKTLGARVIVTSSSDAKIETAINHGADFGINYSTDSWHKPLVKEHGPIDLAIDGAGGDTYLKLIDTAKPGGRIVNYGATSGAPKNFDIFKVFWKQLHLIGTTMGSPEDFEAMISLVNTHKLQPTIDHTFPLSDGESAMNLLRDSHHGKIVLVLEQC